MQTKLIIVDAGHGQSNRRPGVFDPGAVRYSRNGHGPDQIAATEADFALRYTIALDDALRARGFATLLTRPDRSTSCSLRQRVRLAQENQAALLLSLHLNAAPRQPASGRSARGHEVLYRTRNGRTFAEAVSAALGRHIVSHGPGIVRRPRLHVLRYDPSVLVAHPTLWDLLLGLLDKGEVVLNDNTRTDFRKTLVFLTGNAGGRDVAQALSGGIGFAPDRGSGSFSRIAVRSAERVFSPEFRNRLTATLAYQPLSWEELLRVCRLELARLAARLRAREPDWVALQYEAAAVEQIARQGYEAKFGARHIRRAIERMVEEPLANLLASGAIGPEDSIVICAGSHPVEGLRFRRKQ